ncbi:MAG: type III pantothenate kinase [Deltaproteobacteria bacterium]|nr:type III pantothenate kinase [Deltaproteobacteria bacterium]
MLAIDIGNTHITHAIFDGPNIRKIWEMNTGLCHNSDTYWDTFSTEVDYKPKEIAISSVCKPITKIVVDTFKTYLKVQPFIIDNKTDMGIKNLYLTTETLGVDRLINAAAAYHIYKTSLIIVDIGSATTIDYVTAGGEFIGGVIAPGLISAYKGLISQATALPKIELSASETVTGRSTDTCMRSGVILGHAAMINEMVRLIGLEQGSSPTVIVTGGLSTILEEWLNKDYILDRSLTLKGIYIIYKRIRH